MSIFRVTFTGRRNADPSDFLLPLVGGERGNKRGAKKDLFAEPAAVAKI